MDARSPKRRVVDRLTGASRLAGALLPVVGAIPPSVAAGEPSQVISSDAAGAASVAAADVDGDGDLDVLSASSWDDKVAWYENVGGGGTVWLERGISLTAFGAAAVVAADVDGDRDPDAVVASTWDDRVAWHENLAGDGSAWVAHTVAPDALGADAVFAADVDGDGDLDVLSASLYDDTVAWHENLAGDGTLWSRHDVTRNAFGATAVAAADVDGDEDLDVLAASIWGDTIAWHENLDGRGGLWSEHIISSEVLGAVSVAAADLDGDDDLDVLSASLHGDTVAFHENADGAGSSWRSRVITDDAFGASWAVAADLDGDLDLDALTTAAWDNEVAWHENVAGDGSVWTRRLVSVGAAGAWSAAVADVDGDAVPDALSAWRYVDTVAWHEGLGDGFVLLFGDDFESGDTGRWSSVAH